MRKMACAIMLGLLCAAQAGYAGTIENWWTELRTGTKLHASTTSLFSEENGAIREKVDLGAGTVSATSFTLPLNTTVTFWIDSKSTPVRFLQVSVESGSSTDYVHVGLTTQAGFDGGVFGLAVKGNCPFELPICRLSSATGTSIFVGTGTGGGNLIIAIIALK